MPKVTDVLKLIASKMNHKSLEAATSASDLREVEFTDDEFAEISGRISSFLTPEAALNDPNLIEKYKDQIAPNIKKSIYADLETHLDEVGEKLGVNFGDVKKVRERLDILKEFKPKAGKADDKELESYRTDIATLNAQIKKLNETKDKEITQIKGQASAERNKFVINQELSKFKLADAYSNDMIKKGLFDSVIKEVETKATVRVDESGSIRLFQKDHPDKEIYGANNEVMKFEDLVNPLMKDFVKKQDPTPPTALPPVTNQIPSAAGSMQEHYINQRKKAGII